MGGVSKVRWRMRGSRSIHLLIAMAVMSSWTALFAVVPRAKCCVTCSGTTACSSCSVDHECGSCCAGSCCPDRSGSPIVASLLETIATPDGARVSDGYGVGHHVLTTSISDTSFLSSVDGGLYAAPTSTVTRAITSASRISSDDDSRESSSCTRRAEQEEGRGVIVNPVIHADPQAVVVKANVLPEASARSDTRTAGSQSARFE